MLNKYYNKTKNQIKNTINCYSFFDNRATEGLVYNTKKFDYINIGFKYLVKLNKNIKLSKLATLKASYLETVFNDISFNHIYVKKNLGRFNIWLVLVKAFKKRCLIKGRFLNPVYGGFSIGVYGFVAFLPKKLYLHNKNSLVSVFWIKKIDFSEKKILLSQKEINNSASKILFKLASKIMYITKN